MMETFSYEELLAFSNKLLEKYVTPAVLGRANFRQDVQSALTQMRQEVVRPVSPRPMVPAPSVPRPMVPAPTSPRPVVPAPSVPRPMVQTPVSVPSPNAEKELFYVEELMKALKYHVPDLSPGGKAKRQAEYASLIEQWIRTTKLGFSPPAAKLARNRSQPEVLKYLAAEYGIYP